MSSSLADSRSGSRRATARAASSASTVSPRSSARPARRSSAPTRSRSRSSRCSSTHASYQPGSSSSPASVTSSDRSATGSVTAARSASTSTTTSAASPMLVRSAASSPSHRWWVCATARRRLASARASVLSGHSVPATCARARVPLSASRAHSRCSRPPSATTSPSTTSCHPPRRLRPRLVANLVARLVSRMVDHRDIPLPSTAPRRRVAVIPCEQPDSAPTPRGEDRTGFPHDWGRRLDRSRCRTRVFPGGTARSRRSHARSCRMCRPDQPHRGGR